jgi:putative Mg2+ transporter-C (MgtC) family protein
MSMLVDEFATGLALPLPIIALRLFGAAARCAGLGFEREATDHAAGLRTHMLVGLAAATFSLVTLSMIEGFGEGVESTQLDPIRLVEAVTAGVAFLAAGMIIFNRGRVRGLTTGAGMWVAGGIGLCAGLGLWAIAVMTALFALAISALLRLVIERIGEDGGDAD